MCLVQLKSNFVFIVVFFQCPEYIFEYSFWEIWFIENKCIICHACMFKKLYCHIICWKYSLCSPKQHWNTYLLYFYLKINFYLFYFAMEITLYNKTNFSLYCYSLEKLKQNLSHLRGQYWKNKNTRALLWYCEGTRIINQLKKDFKKAWVERGFLNVCNKLNRHCSTCYSFILFTWKFLLCNFNS